jgi:FkbM family methyltransferase
MKALLKKIFAYFGYQLNRAVPDNNPQKQKQLEPRHFFDMFFSNVNPDDFFFVQIGANDGKTRDILYPYVTRHNLRGILVEPQVDIFERLKDNYKGIDSVTFANVAISNEDGRKSFYKVKDTFITEANFFEVTAIASFNKDVFDKTLTKRIGRIIENVSPNLADYTDEIVVDTLTLKSFVRSYDVQKIDFLFLDCEGYDFEILKMFDFGRFSPKIINYESKFQSDEERRACEGLLESKGYTLFRHGNDTCAFRSVYRQ